MLGKMSRRSRASVVLPLEEQPERATMRAFLSAMAVVRRNGVMDFRAIYNRLGGFVDSHEDSRSTRGL